MLEFQDIFSFLFLSTCVYNLNKNRKYSEGLKNRAEENEEEKKKIEEERFEQALSSSDEKL